jgi:KDO2-lipid IV(A) lauroyltransferase
MAKKKAPAPAVRKMPQKSLPVRAWHAIRYSGEYALLRSVEALFRAMGVDRASAFSGKLWEMIAPHTRRHAAALRHLEVAFPNMDRAARELLARDVWNNLGRTFAEAILLREFARDPARIRLMSPDIMQNIARAKGRVVVTSMHSANWELIAPVFKAAGYPMAFIYQRVNNPLSERHLRRLRLNFFSGGVYPKGDTAPRRLIAWLKEGNPVLILADQRTGDLPLKFFGYNAPSTPLPAFMARGLRAPLIAARLVRTEGAHFDLYLEEIPVARTPDAKKDVAQTSQVIQSVFERWIRDKPGQWMWAHRRWTYKGPPANWPPKTKTRGPKAAR